jgi:hypothetical protein
MCLTLQTMTSISPHLSSENELFLSPTSLYRTIRNAEAPKTTQSCTRMQLNRRRQRRRPQCPRACAERPGHL